MQQGSMCAFDESSSGCTAETRHERDRAEAVAMLVIPRGCQIGGRKGEPGRKIYDVGHYLNMVEREREAPKGTAWLRWMEGHHWGRTAKRSRCGGGQWVQLRTWLLVVCGTSSRHWIWVRTCVHRYRVWTWAGVSAFQYSDLLDDDDGDIYLINVMGLNEIK